MMNQETLDRIKAEYLDRIAEDEAAPKYLIVASFTDIDEDFEAWARESDIDRDVVAVRDWASACEAKRFIEAEGLAAYIVDVD